MSQATSLPGLAAAIRTVYDRQPATIDKIVLDPKLASDFCEWIRKAAASLGQTEDIEDDVILARAMAMRKRGEANGGLPRKHRSYNGRCPPHPR